MRKPLIWLVHGEPGTGKSEILLLCKKLFAEVCGWTIGTEYQMTSLQAVTAQLFGGDTLHSACGICPIAARTNTIPQQTNRQRETDVTKQILQWKW